MRTMGAGPDLQFTRYRQPAGRLTLVISQAIGCYYFTPGLWLPFKLYSVSAVGQYRFPLLDDQAHVCEGLSYITA